MENRAEQRRRAVLEALTRATEPLIAARAKENKVESGKVHGRGKVCQNSDKTIKSIDTKKEAAARAKEKQKQKAGGGSGPSGRQKSAQPSKTREEAAALAGVGHDTFHKGGVALDQGSTPTPARPGTPTLGGQDQRTTDGEAHGAGSRVKSWLLRGVGASNNFQVEA